MTTPWWDCLALRDEIAKAGGNINDVQMSLHAAAYEPNTIYGDVGYYSEITYPTSGLVELMASIAIRLAAPTNSGSVKPVWRGAQGMGGGKSHAQVGLFHMAQTPGEFLATDLGRKVQGKAQAIAGEAIPDDLNNPSVVVLPCDRMDPFRPDKKRDNIAETLGQRWLWRLFDGDLNRYHAYVDGLGTPDGIKDAMAATGRPVLTLIDEVLSYIRKATSDSSQTDRAFQDMSFLRDLMEATNTTANAALVIVMIASDDDQVAMPDSGERIRSELEGMLDRYARSMAATEGGDFAEIIRRRLFAKAPPAEVVKASVDTYREHAVGGWADQFKSFPWWTDGFADHLARSYPFHPALIALVEREWANRAGFQKVRSTIQIFAATVHAWMERASDGQWAPPLIGLGDLPLSDTKVRESIIDSGVIADEKAKTNFREIAGNDIVSPDGDRGAAHRIDVDRVEGKLLEDNPRVAERLGTALWVLSLAPRSQGVSGATEAELLTAGYVPAPACELAEVSAVMQLLEDHQRGISTLEQLPGKGGNPRRLFISTKMTLSMFFRNQRGAVLDHESDTILRETARAEMKAGPFEKSVFISTEGHVDRDVRGDELTRGLLDAIEANNLDEPSNRLVVLDPTSFTLLNGVDSETRIAVSAALGLKEPEGWSSELAWPQVSSHGYASSCIFVLVNTQRRKAAVEAARDLIAWSRVADLGAVTAEQPLLDEANAQVAKARRDVTERLSRAFQHIVYLGEQRNAVPVKLEKDQQTALNGATVWAVLTERDKAFAKDEFDAAVLKYQMGDRYWGKPLASLRADFYRSPRFPLLFEGDADLRRALWGAINADPPVLVVKDQSGEVMHAGSPADFNLTANSFTIDRVAESEPARVPPTTDKSSGPSMEGSGGEEGGTYGVDQHSGGGATAPVQPGGGSAGPASGARKVNLSLLGGSLKEEKQRDAGYETLMALARAVDEGRVSFAKIIFEVIVDDQLTADELTARADDLGASANQQPFG